MVITYNILLISKTLHSCNCNLQNKISKLDLRTCSIFLTDITYSSIQPYKFEISNFCISQMLSSWIKKILYQIATIHELFEVWHGKHDEHQYHKKYQDDRCVLLFWYLYWDIICNKYVWRLKLDGNNEVKIYHSHHINYG